MCESRWTTTKFEKKTKRTIHKIWTNVDDRAQSPRKAYAGLLTTGEGFLVDTESLCNNIGVSCTTNVEEGLELSEPWIDEINGQSEPWGFPLHALCRYCRWDTLDVMPRLCATARLTSSDGPNIRAFRKIEYVGGRVTPWLRPEIHPNQAAKHDRSDL